MPRRSIGWSFPSNNNGREDGLNDPGIETFRDSPLRSLSREGPQNSCDAWDEPSGKPVEIHFELLELPPAKIPDAAKLKDTLKRCARYWRRNEAARRFFAHAQQLMSGAVIRVLKMSDYNTTGLRGPLEDRNSDWFKLTKAVGASDKAGGAGGSFGIGKHAPFACSDLRTVLYGTKNNDGDFAFQGVSKLVTHENSSRKTTQGTGYYGFTSRNTPITKSTLVNKMFRRTKIGTDVYMLGLRTDDSWQDEVMKGLIESFFVSIHEERMLARVGATLLNKNSLPELIEKYARDDRNWAARSYYQALTSDDAAMFTEDDFAGLGRVELRVLAGRDHPKRIAMVRSSGMKIYDKGHFQTPSRFAGVFIAKGERLNAFLKSLEPPSHDKWEDKRGEDPRAAKATLKDLHAWINDKVRSLSDAPDTEELDAEGVSHFLPDELEDARPSRDDASEQDKAEPLPEIITQVRLHDPRVTSATGAFEDGRAGEGESPIVDGPGESPGGGSGTGGGNGAGTGSGGNGETAPTGGNGAGPAPSVRPIGLRGVRVYCSDPSRGRYRVMAEPEESGEGHIVVYVIGEVGQEVAPVREAYLPDSTALTIAGKRGAIGPLKMQAGQRIAVDVVLEGALHCALGVTAHAG